MKQIHCGGLTKLGIRNRQQVGVPVTEFNRLHGGGHLNSCDGLPGRDAPEPPVLVSPSGGEERGGVVDGTAPHRTLVAAVGPEQGSGGGGPDQGDVVQGGGEQEVALGVVGEGLDGFGVSVEDKRFHWGAG